MSESSPAGEPSSDNTDSGKDSSFECGVCGDILTTQRGLRGHMKNYHPDELLIECPTCDDCFENRYGMKIHHSKVHGESISGVKVQCETCGKHFRKLPAVEEKTNYDYCSTECMARHRKHIFRGENSPSYVENKPVIQCENCGDEFEIIPSRKEKARFCSRNCKDTWQVKNLNGENNPNYEGGETLKYGPNWEQQRRKAIKRDGGKCQLCGVNRDQLEDDITVHHITKRKKFIDENGDFNYKRANRLGNLICLCRSCHAKCENWGVKPDRR